MDSLKDWRVWGVMGLGAAALGLVSVGTFYLGLQRGCRNKKSSVQGKSYNSADPLIQYATAHNKEDTTLARLRAFSIEHSKGRMTSSVEVGRLLTIFCRVMEARKVIDIGVFTGCSAYAMALGLSSGGCVIACDVSLEYVQLGQPFWLEGGVSDKIDLRLQPALKTLQELIDGGEKGTFDMIFIDAVKVEYPEYFAKGLVLLRPGGLFVVDNALWGGKVADSANVREDTEAIRKINRLMCDSEEVEFLLLNIADGIGIGLKK